jgi:hypothetical protein
MTKTRSPSPAACQLSKNIAQDGSTQRVYLPFGQRGLAGQVCNQISEFTLWLNAADPGGSGIELYPTSTPRSALTGREKSACNFKQP